MLLPYLLNTVDMYIAKISGITVIALSPLMSLMTDQQQKFSWYGLVTQFVGEAQEDCSVVALMKKGKFDRLLPQQLHTILTAIGTCSYLPNTHSVAC